MVRRTVLLTRIRKSTNRAHEHREMESNPAMRQDQWGTIVHAIYRMPLSRIYVTYMLT